MTLNAAQLKAAGPSVALHISFGSVAGAAEDTLHGDDKEMRWVEQQAARSTVSLGILVGTGDFYTKGLYFILLALIYYMISYDVSCTKGDGAHTKDAGLCTENDGLCTENRLRAAYTRGS